MGLRLRSDSAPLDQMTAAEQRKAEYLAKAKEAEDMAEKAKDEESKADWLRIAAGYHALVAHQDKRP